MYTSDGAGPLFAAVLVLIPVLEIVAFAVLAAATIDAVQPEEHSFLKQATRKVAAAITALMEAVAGDDDAAPTAEEPCPLADAPPAAPDTTITDAGAPTAGAPDTGQSKRFTPEQQDIIARAKRGKKTGLTQEEAEKLVQEAKDAGLDGSRGPETHPDRPHGKKPHIHIGPIDHIPVI